MSNYQTAGGAFILATLHIKISNIAYNLYKDIRYIANATIIYSCYPSTFDFKNKTANTSILVEMNYCFLNDR